MALEIWPQFDYLTKFDLCWPFIGHNIHRFGINKNFRSFKVYVIKIGQLGGALEPFSGFSSFCSRAPPRDRRTSKIINNQLQIEGFQTRYDSWGWLIRWRHKRIVIYFGVKSLEPFSGCYSFCFRAPPRDCRTSKIKYSKLQIEGFQMRYDSWGWLIRWRHKRIVIYYNFWWVFHRFRLRKFTYDHNFGMKMIAGARRIL